MDTDAQQWQLGVWDRIAPVYETEIDPRFAPLVQRVLDLAGVETGDHLLDLGTGTGAVAVGAAALVGPAGRVTAVDISPEMLVIAGGRARAAGLANVHLVEGGAEDIPAEAGTCDVLTASLSLMYVIDRTAAAAECARVLRAGGRMAGAVWAGPDRCDIVRFQATAGRFAPPPPVAGVGPGALADPGPFLDALAAHGLKAKVQTEPITFEFPDFNTAWDVLASVTTAGLPPERIAEAKEAVRQEMWPDPAAPRTFVNATHFIVGERRSS
jgi:SAM-dependent methyltransferase